MRSGIRRRRLPLVRTRVKTREVARVLPILRVGLQDHPPDAARLVVLAYGERAELRLDRAVHVLDRDAEQRRLGAVDVGAQLLRVRAIRRVERRELRTSACFLQELLRDFVELDRIAAAGVLDPEFESAGRADTRYRRRRDRQDDAALDMRRLLE